MNYVRCIKTTFLLVILVAFIGCKSKQDAPAPASWLLLSKNRRAAEVPPQDKSAAAVVPPQDKADAQAAAVRVLAPVCSR